MDSKPFYCKINVYKGKFKSLETTDYDSVLAQILRERTGSDKWMSYTEKKELERKEAEARGEAYGGRDDTRLYERESGLAVWGVITLEDYIKYDIDGIVEELGMELKSITLTR